MNPQTQFCHNPDCRARGQVGQGNIHVHSQTAQRYRCTTCGQTFSVTKATPFYRLRTAADARGASAADRRSMATVSTPLLRTPANGMRSLRSSVR